MEAWRIADLHAYVDDCLGPDGRLAFEQQMAQDPALARRAAQWRAQNSAIRTEFGGESAKAFPISILRHDNETQLKARRSPPVVGRSPWDEPTRQLSATTAGASRFSPNSAAAGAFRSSLLCRLGLAGLAFCLAFVWAPAATVVPAKGLRGASIAAFQAFTRPGVEPVEFATSDRTEAQAWLRARLMHPVDLPATPSTVRLTGAWIAPYPGSPAAFLVYRSQEGPVGLLVQSLDAPATSTPQLLAAADGRTTAVWTWRSQGFALFGELDTASLFKIATDFFDPPVEAVQATPDRGW
jgi:anti-sigma factor RsiW